MHDVIIIGGGPAGMSAALLLARCRRDVLLCDAGQPRNGRSSALHGYLTRDGISPHEFLRLGREELLRYGITSRSSTVVNLGRVDDAFVATMENGERVHARMALIATGVRDNVPDIPGVDACYGSTIHHCPYCDGWEHRDKTIVVLGRGTTGAGLSLALKTWTSHIVLCTNGPTRLRAADRQRLTDHGIAVHRAAIARVDHDGPCVRAIVYTNGSRVPCDAMFLPTDWTQQCDLAKDLGCEMTGSGTVKTDHLGQTRIAGLYVVGDASFDVQFAIVAAAEGAKAAVAINKALQRRAGQVTSDPASVEQPLPASSHPRAHA